MRNVKLSSVMQIVITLAIAVLALISPAKNAYASAPWQTIPITGLGTFETPVGLAIDNSGNIYVSGLIRQISRTNHAK